MMDLLHLRLTTSLSAKGELSMLLLGMAATLISVIKTKSGLYFFSTFRQIQIPSLKFRIRMWQKSRIRAYPKHYYHDSRNRFCPVDNSPNSTQRYPSLQQRKGGYCPRIYGLKFCCPPPSPHPSTKISCYYPVGTWAIRLMGYLKCL